MASQAVKRLGGVDVDSSYRIKSPGLTRPNLYCGAIPYLLHKHPFIQGITSAAEIGEVMAKAVLDDMQEAGRFERLTA